MKPLSSAVLMAMALAVCGSAAAYQMEVGADYHSWEASGVKQTLFGFHGDYYLEPLTADGVVFAEAAFLKKASHVGVLYNNYEIDVDTPFGTASSDYNEFGVQGRYIYSSDRDYIIEGQLSFGDNDTVSVAGGFYRDAKTEVVAGFSSSDFEDRFFGRYKTMTSFKKFDTVVAQAELYVVEGDLGLDVDADVFLDRNTSVGLGTGFYFGEDTQVPIEVRGKYFLTEELAFFGGVGAQDITDFDLAYTLGVIGRF